MTLTLTADETAAETRASWPSRGWTSIRRNPTIFIGGLLLALLAVIAVVGPYMVADPFRQNPIK